MNSPDFPSDVKQQVERLVSACAGRNLGSYSGSPGIITVREDIANFIQQRDGYPSDPNNIYLCNGASDGLKTVIKLLMNNNPKKPSGIVSPKMKDNLNDLVFMKFTCIFEENSPYKFKTRFLRLPKHLLGISHLFDRSLDTNVFSNP